MTRTQTLTVDEAFALASDFYLEGLVDEQVDSFDRDMQATLQRILAPWHVEVISDSAHGVW